jgi:hypothetical protein
MERRLEAFGQVFDQLVHLAAICTVSVPSDDEPADFRHRVRKRSYRVDQVLLRLALAHGTRQQKQKMVGRNP